MEIVKQTEKEIVFKVKENFLDHFIPLLLIAPFIALPLFFASAILSEMGVIKVSCQRVEPTQVNCQVNSSKYLGLIQGSSTSLNSVAEATLNSQSDIYGSNYFVTLVSQTGKEVVSLQGNLHTNSFKGFPPEMLEITTKINKFINNSTEPSLLIQYDLRWKWDNLLFLAFSIIFLGAVILFVYKIFNLETLILIKSEKQLTYKVYSLLGLCTKTKHYSFAQIKELILDIYTDSDYEYKFYSLKIVLPAENQNHQREVTLTRDYSIEKVKKLANFVADFIEKPYQEVSNE
ncbi:MAG: hypothetical protein F6K17_26200 [Okeania sp. SIO3C4]|nr:hypothetical protein [Okeania sp. SIO3B3]NER05835.1 hypothetical protein [Okeania sp. SIO3C4]